MLDTHLQKKRMSWAIKSLDDKEKKLTQNYKVYRHLFSLFGYGLKKKYK